MGMSRRYLFIAAIVGGLGMMPFLAGTAKAIPTTTCDGCIAYDFNYTDGSITNVAKIQLTDPSEIQQTFVGGLPTGAFSETGALHFLLYQTAQPGPTGGCTTAVCASGSDLPITTTGGNKIYAVYDFTGTVDLAAGTVTFNPGGQISIFEDTTGEVQLANGRIVGSSLPLATFTLVAGSAGISGGAAGVTLSAEQFLLKQTSGNPNILTDTLGNSLFDRAIELVTGDAHTQGFVPCGSVDLGVPGTTMCTSASTLGRLFATEVPEPGSLGLLGIALVAFGAFVRRRRKHSATPC